MQDKEYLYQRYAKAKGDWMNWRVLYEEAYWYTMPERNPWPDEVLEGQIKNIGVYDTTAIGSARRLVARLHQNLFPTGDPWFKLEPGEGVPEQAKQSVEAQLAPLNKILYRALDKSNFNLVSTELLQDLIIGTGAMMILENDDDDVPFLCKSVALDKVFPEGDSFDQINTVWRDIPEMRAEDIEAFWPSAVITDEMRQAMEDNECVTFVMIEGIIYDRDKKKYRHIVMADGYDTYVVDQELESSPWVIARWSKNTHEVGGRGPILDALPTIKSANKLTEFILTNVGLSTSPPWLAATDGVFNPYLFEIAPNKIIPISRTSLEAVPLRKLDVSGEINLGSLELQDLRQQIKDMLYDNPVSPVADPKQTATLTMLQHQNWLETVGPAWGRLLVELLPESAKRIIHIMQRRGLLPKHLNIDGKIINIKYSSPLEESRSLSDLNKFQQFMQIMVEMFGPQLALATVNIQDVPEWVGNKLGVDPKLIKASGDIQSAIQQMTQPQQPQAPDPNQQAAQDAGQAQLNPAQMALGQTANQGQ
jgi:hypothetical protein